MLDPSDREENAGGTRTPSINATSWQSQPWAAPVLFGVKYKVAEGQVDLEI